MRPSKRIVECEEAREAREELGGEDQMNDSVESEVADEAEIASMGVTKLSRFFSTGCDLVSATVDSPFQALRDRIDSADARERARLIERGVRGGASEAGVLGLPERANNEKPRLRLCLLSFLVFCRRAGRSEAALPDELVQQRAARLKTGIVKMVLGR